MLPGLLEIGAIAGAIERHLALFATALGANAPVHGGTEALFLADFTDRAAHEGLSLSYYGIPALLRDDCAGSLWPLPKPAWQGHFQSFDLPKRAFLVPFWGPPSEKTA